MEKPADLKKYAEIRVKEQNEFWKMYEASETNAEIEEQLNKLFHALRYFPSFKDKIELNGEETPTTAPAAEQSVQPPTEHEGAGENKTQGEGEPEPQAQAAGNAEVNSEQQAGQMMKADETQSDTMQSVSAQIAGLELLDDPDQLIFREKADADGKKTNYSGLEINYNNSDSDEGGYDFGPNISVPTTEKVDQIETIPAEEEIEEHENAWNPSDRQESSTLNIGVSTDEDIMRLRGVKIPAMDICKFNDGKSGKCFKGKNCFMKHPILGEEDREEAKSKTEVSKMFFFKDLPKKRVPGDAAVFYGHVSYSHSPYEFFILPEQRFDCACKQNPEVKDTPEGRIEYAEYFNEGQFAFDELMKDLHIYMCKHYLKMQKFKYAREEIVCCRSADYGWARGVVLNDADINDEENRKAWVFLMDIGDICEFGLNDLAGTIESFIKLPPLVYRCSLFGVTCVGRDYSNPACDFFSRLFQDQRRVCIENMLVKDGKLNREFMETSPYLVDLTIKIHGRVVRVAEILAHFHFAINSNPFPFRPSLITSGAITLRDAVVLRATGPLEPSQELLDRETRRFQRFCELKNVDVCGNPLPQEEETPEFSAKKQADVQDWIRKSKTKKK